MTDRPIQTIVRTRDGRLLGSHVADYRGVNLRGQVVTGIVYEHADFRDADFRGTTFNGCRFIDCNFMEVQWDGAVLNNCEFERPCALTLNGATLT